MNTSAFLFVEIMRKTKIRKSENLARDSFYELANAGSPNISAALIDTVDGSNTSQLAAKLSYTIYVTSSSKRLV